MIVVPEPSTFPIFSCIRVYVRVSHTTTDVLSTVFVVLISISVAAKVFVGTYIPILVQSIDMIIHVDTDFRKNTPIAEIGFFIKKKG